ncbi:hypothetical protein L7F22_051819 [Adiantum nelumboides]|nr:hypothetical protein [Adiantum nelumboides]
MARQRMVGDYVLMQQLGTGSFAVVWKGKHRHTGAEVAIKEIASDKLTRKLCENLMSEINILKKTNHPNIIRLYETISASNRIYLVLEFCAGGDLGAYINRHGKVPETTARHFMRQLGAGLQVLRANNLIHRDLKPQNLLLSSSDTNAVLKIADFGFARSLQPQGLAETLCGSPLYMAPEILLSKKYDAKADLWSVGTILYQLVTGQPPFTGQSPFQLLQNIQKSTILHFPNSALHPECVDLCRKLLRKDPVERLSFEEFFNHSFIAEPIRSEPTCFSSGESLPCSAEARSFQEEPMPFLLDEDPQFLSASPMSNAHTTHKANPFNALRGSGERDIPVTLPERKGIFQRERGSTTFKNESVDANQSKAVASEALQTAAEGEQCGFAISHSKGGMMDSMEVLEKEYVLVSVPVTSTDAISLSASEQFTGVEQQSPCKNPQKVSVVNAPLPKAVLLEDTGASQDLVNFAVSRANRLTRLQVLHKCAETIVDLAHNKCVGGQFLEAFSMHLVCLAVWKEAMSISSRRAGGFDTHPSGDNEYRKFALDFLCIPENECGFETICSRIEQRFCATVEQAEVLAPHVQCLDGNTEIPEPMEIMYQAALATGKTAAVDELMGNLSNAAAAYSKAATLLYFLLVEAAALPITPRLLLGNADKQRLRNYLEIIASRQNLCAANKMKYQQ